MPEITVQARSSAPGQREGSRRGIVFLHGAGGSHHTFPGPWAGLKAWFRL